MKIETALAITLLFIVSIPVLIYPLADTYCHTFPEARSCKAEAYEARLNRRAVRYRINKLFNDWR